MVFEGVVFNISRWFYEFFLEYICEMMSKYMIELFCEICYGKWLSCEVLFVYVGGLNIGEVVEYLIS